MTDEISAAWGSEGGKGRSGGYSSSSGSRGKGRRHRGGRRSVSPSGSQASLWSAATGDSVATDQSGDSAHSAHSTRSAGARSSAVAEVTGPAVPTIQSHASKHKQSQPPAVAGQVPPRGRGPSLNERDDVGNIGWFFGNWGLCAAKKAVKDNIDQQLEKTLVQSSDWQNANWQLQKCCVDQTTKSLEKIPQLRVNSRRAASVKGIPTNI